MNASSFRENSGNEHGLSAIQETRLNTVNFRLKAPPPPPKKKNLKKVSKFKKYFGQHGYVAFFR